MISVKAVNALNEFIKRIKKLTTIFTGDDGRKMIKKQFNSCKARKKCLQGVLTVSYVRLIVKVIIKFVLKQERIVFFQGWQKRVIETAIGKTYGY